MPYVYIHKLQHLTLTNVLAKVYTNATVRKYLPDYDQPVKYMNREFLFAIVNRLDPTFFDRACQEIEALPKPKKENEVPKTLNIKPDLLNILRRA